MKIRKPFKGSFFYEWQIGTFVFQVKRRDFKSRYFRWFHVWRDPHWKEW